MTPELMQIGRDAESLVRYIAEHGDNASKQIILAQIKLLNFHTEAFKASVSDGQISSVPMVREAVSRR